MDQQPSIPKSADIIDRNKRELPAQATDSKPNLSPGPADTDETTNGEANDNWQLIEVGSESHAVDAQAETQNMNHTEKSTNQTESLPTVSKSVHWSNDLVTESHASNTRNYDYNMSDRDGSNPYVSHSPAVQSSSFSFKGIYRMFYIGFVYLYNYTFVNSCIRYDGECERHARALE